MDAAAPSVALTTSTPKPYEYGSDKWVKGGKRTARSLDAFQYSAVPSTGALNQEQRYWMMTAIGTFRNENPKSPAEGPAFFDSVARQWNSIHDKESLMRPGGIGGYIRPTHVKAFIAKESQSGVSGSVGVQPSPSFVTSAAPPMHFQQPHSYYYQVPMYLPPEGAPVPHGFHIEYKKQVPPPAEKKTPPAVEGYDDIDRVADHSWRDCAKVLEYYGLPSWGLSGDQITRLEGHLEKLGKKKSTCKKRKKNGSGKSKTKPRK